MQNDQSAKRGAPKHRGGPRKADGDAEMLSATEAAAAQRGATFKRVVRAAAAMQGIYDDARLADATTVTRGTVVGWWRGSQPAPARLRSIASATGLSVDELIAFTYYGGPPPRLPDSEEAEAEARAAAAERSHHARPAAEVSDGPPVLRETAGSGRRVPPLPPNSSPRTG